MNRGGHPERIFGETDWQGPSFHSVSRPTPPHRPNWKGNMTKDFNEQRRGDVRPSSRNQSSGRHGEERSPRPARPRLNRETVDRAWESGASRNHADYRPRTTNGQPSRDNRWRNQYGNSPSAENGRRPYSNQQNNYRRSERTPNDNHKPGTQSSDSRRFDDRRSSDRRNYSERPAGTHPRSRSGPGFRDNEHYRDQRPPYRDGDHDRSRGDERRGFDRDNRSQRTFNDSNRQHRDFQRPNTQNPRWRSRPMAQNDDQPRGRQDFNRNGRFEGDYERFETPEASRPQRPLNRLSEGNSAKESEERHVTRLADGRVLKGPRPVQRKQAQFWTEISDDVEALVEPIDASGPVEKAPTQDNAEGSMTKVTRKTRTRTEGTAARGRNRGTKQSKPKARSTGPKPSQRGFKWPTS